MMLDFPSHHRSPHALARLVSSWHGVAMDALASGQTAPDVMTARQDLVQILTEFTPLGLPEIGHALKRPPSAIAFLLRQAKSAEQLHQLTRLRLIGLRSAAQALPAEFGAPCGASPHDIARVAVGSQVSGAFERVALANIAAAQVLRDANLSAEDARHAAFCLLTRPGDVPAASPVHVA